MRRKPSLSATAYAILGLLSLRPSSAYDLARQMKRNLHHFWPRAESHVYGEPKTLVALGLARGTQQYVGRRARMVYTITPKGRLALRRWLATPGAPPTVEFEGLVKVLFAEQGTKRQLLATLNSVRERVQTIRYAEAARAREIIRTDGPLLLRLPAYALAFEFMWEYWDMVLRWAQWAAERAASWPDTMNARVAPGIAGPLRKAAREAREGRRGSVRATAPPSDHQRPTPRSGRVPRRSGRIAEDGDD